MRAPAQAEPFLIVAFTSDVRITVRGVFSWLERVMCAIPDKYAVVDRPRGNDVWVLRHVARLVDLARVSDLLRDLPAKLLFASSVTADLIGGLIVFRSIWLA